MLSIVAKEAYAAVSSAQENKPESLKGEVEKKTTKATKMTKTTNKQTTCMCEIRLLGQDGGNRGEKLFFKILNLGKCQKSVFSLRPKKVNSFC